MTNFGDANFSLIKRRHVTYGLDMGTTVEQALQKVKAARAAHEAATGDDRMATLRRWKTAMLELETACDAELDEVSRG
jgi:hypothetical protein